jgi:hypothetical protein
MLKPKSSQSSGCTHSPNNPKKFKEMSAKKLIAAVFWDRKGILLVECMQQGTIITSKVYCETLKKLHRAIQNKRHAMLTSSAVFLHDNARPHTAARTQALLEHFNWELFDSTDLTLSNCHQFPYLQNWLGSQHFNNNEMMMEGVAMWLSLQAADFSDRGRQKYVPLYDMCLNSSGDSIEK